MADINKEKKVTKNDLLEAIRRSGYLMESQISEVLSKAGFFVESNQVIKDRLTGKSREIDLLAEYYDDRDCTHNIKAKIKFVFEIKNNTYPMVFLTSYKSTPNIEIWESLREVITETDAVKFSPDDGFFDMLIGYKEKGIYTQYCSFKKKKEGGRDAELMAWHPDDFHEGLVKIVQYCDEEVDHWNAWKPDKYARDFLYLPVLVLGSELYVLFFEEKGKAKLHEVKSAKLLYNYHRDEEPKIAIIYVVTKKGFPEFINEMLKVEESIENKMRIRVNGK